MPKELNPIKIAKGIYLLELYATLPFEIGIKKYKGINLKSGYYYYAGSAQKNFTARIFRHLKKEKIIHWHIDNLTTKNNLSIENIFAFPLADKKEECKLVKNLTHKFGMAFPAKGFGNSDCNSCTSHLLYSIKRIDQSQLFALYQSMVLFNPSSKEISG